MKALLKITGIIFLMSSLITSCSIEKRHYSSGYHIEWKHRIKTGTVSSASEEVKSKETKEEKTINENFNNSGDLQITNDENQTEKTVEKSETNRLVSDQIKDQQGIFIEENNLETEAQKQTIIRNDQQTNTTGIKPVKPMASTLLLIVLCFIPLLSLVAVGIATNWGDPVIWNLCWYLTGIGWIIHGIVVVTR